MKKNKLNTYFLLASVVVIWAIIAIRIFKNLHKKNNNELFTKENIEHVEMEFLDRKYKLALSYDDPFFGNSGSKNVKKGTKRNSKSFVANVTKKEEEIVPEIKYYGSIIGSSKIAIVKIDNKSLIVKENDESLNCKIIKIYKESLLVSINGKKTKIIKGG